MNNLIKKIQIFSHRYDLWKEGEKIVVGVSGGPDSVCLLDIFVKLAKKRNFEILVAHVNYGLRGGDSDKDELFVRELAKKHGLKIEILDVKNKGSKKNSESDLRNIRYDFFERIRQENSFDLIAVAHNRDDQAETVLMRIIRGSGLMGLASIKPKSNRIIRPLLGISREEIMTYLKSQKIKFRIDKTNHENKFFRNKIRNKLIPLLEKEYNPILRETLSGSVSNIREEYDFLFQAAQKIFRKIDFDADKKKYFFEIKKFNKNHPALQKQVLRRIIFELKSNLLNIDSNNLEEIIKIIKSDKNKSQKLLFKGLKVERKGDIIYISNENRNK